MFLPTLLSSLPGAILLFVVALAIVIIASARFTRKLAQVCTMFNLSLGLLSLLSALGANIPDYASALVAIIEGHTTLGLGIILGSNIYNFTIIFGLCSVLAPHDGIRLYPQAKRHVGVIAAYACALTVCALGLSALLPGSPIGAVFQPARVLFLLVSVLALVLTLGLLRQIFKRAPERVQTQMPRPTLLATVRVCSEIVLILLIALGGVVVMVQAGQALAQDTHMPAVLAGLLILAVATSLPNTVVALSLARTSERAASLEEVYMGASINVVLGIMLPIAIWQGVLQDRFLLLLDGPFLLALMLANLVGIVRGRLGRVQGIVLLGLYLVWVLVRVWI